MRMMKMLLDKLQYIKLYEILGVFIFIFVLPIALIYKIVFKIQKRKVWLISELSNSARDNGFYFYQYLKKFHKEDECYYVIDKKCNDYKKVENLGNIIQYRSLKHWIYYIASDKIISSVKDSSPDHLLFSILHRYFNLFNKFVFLQHGVILNKFPMFFYRNTKFKLFICGAKDEYEEIKNNYGYSPNRVVYTGLARFDGLINNNQINQKQILIMPTWRRWLGRDKNFLGKNEEFTKTTYYKKWMSLLTNKKLIDYIESNNITIKFYPHNGMRKYISDFKVKSKNILIVSSDDEKVQDLLKESALMITDYSSVCSDFAFMRKPIIFYQFDKEEFFSKHVERGYFDFENDGFGKVFNKEEDVIDKIIDYIENDFKIEQKYLKKMKSFFELHDNNNCERIYKAILDMK